MKRNIMNYQFILTAVFALFSLSLFGQDSSLQSTEHDKEKQEKIDNKDSSLTKNGSQCASKDILDVGYQLGVGKYKKNRFSLNALPSYQIKPYLSLGYGGAFRYYHEEEALLIPLLTELRIDFTDKIDLPFLSIRFGHSFEVTDSEYFKDTGYLLEFSLGDSFNISNNILLDMGVGYALQEADVYDPSGLNNDVGLRALSFRVGVLL